MVEGKKRSRTFRRVYVTTPGGRTIIHYRKPRTGQAHCAGCGKVLPAVARGNASALRKLAITERRPERPYGGVLCSGCMRQKILARVRSV